jgi:hypothetical protein
MAIASTPDVLKRRRTANSPNLHPRTHLGHRVLGLFRARRSRLPILSLRAKADSCERSSRARSAPEEELGFPRIELAM